MKKTIFFVFLMIFSLSASTVFAEKSKDNSALPIKSENKLSEEELSRLRNRVEEIRDMDKSDITTKEKRELKKELKGIKETVKRDGGYIYVGAGTVLIIILLVLLLL